MLPRVTVIIPCFNDGTLVREAVESVKEDEPVEIVVVDDGSSDPDTLDVLDELAAQAVRVVRHGENRGVAAARTTGLRESRAAFVFPLDADDHALPGVLAAMADRLEAAPDAAVCFGDYAEFGDRQLVRAVPERIDPFRLAYTNEYPNSSLYRRSALEGAGCWRCDSGAVSYEDWNLWIALVEEGERGIHLGPGRLTYRHRLHGERRDRAEKRRHSEAYRELRGRHPQLSASSRSTGDIRTSAVSASFSIRSSTAAATDSRSNARSKQCSIGLESGRSGDEAPQTGCHLSQGTELCTSRGIEKSAPERRARLPALDGLSSPQFARVG